MFHRSMPLSVTLAFWITLAFALVGLIGRHISPRVLVVLGVLAVTGFLSVWIVAFQTSTYDRVWLWQECQPSLASLHSGSNDGGLESDSCCRSLD